MLGAFAQCLAQDADQAERLRRLGARDVAAIGDLKAAGATLPVDQAQLWRLRRQIGSRPLWLAASTHEGEEAIAAAVHHRLAAEHRGLLTIIAPATPRAATPLPRCSRGRGLSVARRSSDDPVASDTEIYLADTIGELGLFYSLAGIAFIGGSLSRNGGHNPFEAARLDCAILHGPDMSNCAGDGVGAGGGRGGADRDRGRRTRPGRWRLSSPTGGCAPRAAPPACAPLPPARAFSMPYWPGSAPWLDRLAPVRGGPAASAPIDSRTGASLSCGHDARRPGFWGTEPGLAAALLRPIGAAWDTAGRLRRILARPYHAPVPVICVGNLVAGGAGKTPVALALAAWLGARGVAVHVVTRGYGGRLAGPVRVDPARHDFTAVGDEALLLAARAPCWIARDRAAGVAAAVAAGAERDPAR